MELDTKKEGGTLTIKIIGKIDTMTSPKLEEEIYKNFGGVNEVIFNFKISKIFNLKNVENRLINFII